MTPDFTLLLVGGMVSAVAVLGFVGWRFGGPDTLAFSPEKSVRREKPRVSSGRDKANPPGNYSLRPERPGESLR
jgi:hypothetical protein